MQTSLAEEMRVCIQSTGPDKEGVRTRAHIYADSSTGAAAVAVACEAWVCIRYSGAEAAVGEVEEPVRPEEEAGACRTFLVEDTSEVWKITP